MASAHSVQSRVQLLGLDFGSTTSSALVAEAQITSNCITGRMEFGAPKVLFKSTPVFTPFIQNTIDAAAIGRLIRAWLAQSGLTSIFAGGSIITGLAAQSQNAAAITQLVRELVGESVIATAQDPCLESWLAFMGSCSGLSRYHQHTPLLNFDIGGGTTNIALGQRGEVLQTACYFIGARHFQFAPGSYRLTALSDYGRALLLALGIDKKVGDTLAPQHCGQIMDYYCQALEAIALGNPTFFANALGQQLEQVAYQAPAGLPPAKITFSGGVGELIYRHTAGETLPGTTHYGDFGIDLARAISASPVLAANLHDVVPENRGRATVYGLTLHSTEISGTTLFLPAPQHLPLCDLPIVSKLVATASLTKWQTALSLAMRREQGACIQIMGNISRLQDIRRIGSTIAQSLAACAYPPHQTLVILVESNIGKALGNYATDWKKSALNVLVIDEIPIRDAYFVNIGRMHQQIVPISFFGLH